MATKSRAGRTTAAQQPDAELLRIGLRRGDRVRWRRNEGERWREGTVVGRERDGSVGLRDGKGAARAIALERLEVRTQGPRGGVQWEGVAERAARDEQLGLF